MFNFLEKVFRIIGIICVIYSLVLLLQRHNPSRLEFTSSPNTGIPVIIPSRYPTSLKIQSASINLPIIPSRITNGEWETTDKGVSYLTSSPIPGEKGNSILYGHNWSSLLGSLPNIKVNDTIEVYYKNSQKKYFIVQYIAEVTPDQTHVLSASADSRLTVYTCSGFLDMKRLVIVATAKGNDI